MANMGFEDRFINFILQCVNSVQYSILLNGEKGSSFRSSRGLRQGDPLSPYLFLFCGVGLSALALPITHFMFADDCILFGEVSNRGISVMKDILEEYESCSGSNVNDQDKNLVFQILNVRCLTNPERCLGLPIWWGEKRNGLPKFERLIEAKDQQLECKAYLTRRQRGFIKAVLQAIPTYTMACIPLPKPLCLELEKLMGSFWWRKNHGKRGMHWCDWKSLCALKEEGEYLGCKGASFEGSGLEDREWKANAWIPGNDEFRLQNTNVNLSILKVAHLIDANARKWNSELVYNTFSE
ncbi:reverse transcriptase [Gossypium australe]|uniref:Reverse transcriptase n=1 Tax=Gossypium australe TaxID=47621 RepID=A0A5B6UTG9_9ROSI|nr:reverse transcriptase [Gossypium australe]